MSQEELIALVKKLEAAQAGATTINLEAYYWWCTGLMIAIHAGFLAYEMGASRHKNVLASGVKNILAFAFIIPTMYFFGWWIYLSMYNGFVPDFAAGAAGRPYDLSMGPNLADQASGVFWAAFTLFSATVASVFSGGVLERIRMSGFIILAILIGSVVWIWGAAWGWHPDGWLVTKFGYHDVGAAGIVHVITAFFLLGVLINLGPRVGRYADDGTPLPISGHNLPLTLVGLMIIIIGFFGFLGGCLIYSGDGNWTNIYGQPATLSAFVFNTLMGFGGGIIGAYWFTKDPFWMMSGALAGIFSVAAGLDVYDPSLAFALGIVGGAIIKPGQDWLTARGIDDAVGAWSVHGVAGFWGVLACGIFAAGTPGANPDLPGISFFGQLVGGVVLAAFGFITGYVASLILKAANLLRVPDHAQIKGLDIVKVPNVSYPEFQRQPAE